MKGIVIKTTGKHYIVKTIDGVVLQCRLKGKFRLQELKTTNPIVVGDRVEVIQDSGDWVIVELFERNNQIIRKSVNLSKQTHIIAANIDQAILMITLSSPITSTSFIDRFLVSANAYGINVVLLFNKLDIYDNILLRDQKELAEVYNKIGYTTVSLSVLYDNLSKLKSLMKDKLNMISGHSGVGKSTLINKLQLDLNIETKEISKAHRQGQHTTTFSQLYDLDFGASVIDTPGIKGFGLVEIEKNDIGNYFSEFFALKSKCKYHNCIHKDEPECAIKESLSLGDIAASRYENYLDMINQETDNYRIKNY